MKITTRILCLTALLLTACSRGNDFPEIYNADKAGAFPLLKEGTAASIWTDKDDYPVVGICAEFLADDIERVGQVRPQLATASSIDEVEGKNVVIAGTIGHSALIDAIVSEGKIDVSGIEGEWESFIVTTLRKPSAGVDKAFVIAGSDRRGTAFGLTSLCEAIGVSPWYWWADVTPETESALFIQKGEFSQGEPSVRYRGFFINDERFGGWAKWSENTFETETHMVGPKTYRKVFELLLRLKANYLWPAMHPGTQAFNGDPENARLADDYAIVMGTSHCEQMLRNNEDEWKKLGIYGDFNYITNRETMIKYWEDRVKTNGGYENTYTIGLRGIHDYPMEGAETNEDRVRLMQQAINDQRDILRRNIDKDITEIPQVLCTYEEVLEAYHGGLEVPDDVTLLWSDDKQGYLRNLCNPEERRRSGGAGVYYHISYHGDPDSWFWLSPLAPSLISTEMCKSYDYGADRIWVFNVGDIKPAEKELSFAMELAWNIDKWRPEKAAHYIEYWFTKTFGAQNAKEIAALQQRYYRLMAYGKEFHTRWLEYTPEEIEWRLAEWKDIADMTEEIGEQMPERLKSAFFEIFEYPMRGAQLTNEYVLEARKSLVYAGNGGGDALEAAEKSKEATRKVDALTNYYNDELLDGKWAHFFNWRPNWYLEGDRPIMELADSGLLEKVAEAPKPQFIMTEPQDWSGSFDITFTSDKAGVLPLWIHARTPIIGNSFDPENNRYCTVSINGKQFEGCASPHGNIWHTESVGPMWSCVGEIPVEEGENVLALSGIDPSATIGKVFVGYQPPFDVEPAARICAAGFTDSGNSAEGCITVTEGLGYNDGVTVCPSLTPSYEVQDAPWAEYSVRMEEGDNTIEVRTLPTLRIYAGRDARYAVSIDGGEARIFNIHEPDYSSEWRWNVLRGYARRQVDYAAETAGEHKVRIHFLDPGIVVQEITVR